jgi:hypothetical protein
LLYLEACFHSHMDIRRPKPQDAVSGVRMAGPESTQRSGTIQDITPFSAARHHSSTVLKRVRNFLTVKFLAPRPGSHQQACCHRLLEAGSLRQQPMTTSTSSSSPVEPSGFSKLHVMAPQDSRDHDPDWRHAPGDISGIMDGSIA